MPIEIIPIEDRKTWLNLRSYDLNASTIGALWSCHPYMSALRLFIEKQGLVELPKIEDSPVLRRGRIMESAVAEAVREERPEWNIIKANSYYRDTDLSLGATPDYWIEDDPRGLGVLQCKTALPSIYERDWTAERPPLYTILQGQTEAILTQAKFAVVAVLVDDFNKDLHIYDMELHEATWQKIRNAVQQFWRDIDEGKQPGPDYNLDRDLLPLLMPHEVPHKTIDLSTDNEVMAGLAERAHLREQINENEAKCKEIETLIMARMADAEIARVPDFSVTWRTEDRKEYTVKARSSRVLRIRDQRK